MRESFLIFVLCTAPFPARTQGIVVPSTLRTDSFLEWVDGNGRVLTSADGLRIQLYFGSAPDSVTTPDLSGIMTLAESTAFTAVTTGGGVHSVPGLIPSTSAWFQLRAWTGGFASWEAAVASGSGSVLLSAVNGPGAAPIVPAIPGDNSASPPTQPPWIQWTPGSRFASPGTARMETIEELLATGDGTAVSLAVGGVPEPTASALIALGLLGLLGLRRKA